MYRGIPDTALPRIATHTLVFVGATVFISGGFVLATAGQAHAPATLALILGGTALLAVPIALLMLGVAATEAAVGRAWASGFRPLSGFDRSRRGVSERALRYAGALWLANGLALWLATLTSLASG